MLFTRLIWVALAVALLAGSVQSALHQWQAVPIILAAEAFEEHHEHQTAEATADPSHVHGAQEWAPANGTERSVWTWVANVLHNFSLALLTLGALGLWAWRRGPAASTLRLGLGVALAGWVTFHLSSALGLPAEVPGMEVADLGARQGWWLLATGSAALACALAAFGRGARRWALVAACLGLPHLVGAPHLIGDALAAFDAADRVQMLQLNHQFAVVTTWISVSLWLGLGLGCAAGFQRWIQPLLPARSAATSSAWRTTAA
jgi:cobalt transporter subunit CbtA